MIAVLRKLFRHFYAAVMTLLPERLSIQLEARRCLGHFLDLEGGTSFNAKVNRRKLDHSRDSEMAILADKVLVKPFVAARIGPDFVTPTLWHGKTLPLTPPVEWPDRFVIKLNTGSSANIFVSRSTMNWDAVRRRADNLVRRSDLGRHKERWYSLIDPRLLVEPLLVSSDGLPDYKCFTFHGRVEFFQVDVDRFDHHRRVFYSRDWVRQPCGYGPTPFEPDLEVPPPAHLDAIIQGAEALATGWDFVRVDFYDLPEGPRFGEMTFSPGGGLNPFNPYEYDELFGSYWHMERGGVSRAMTPR